MILFLKNFALNLCGILLEFLAFLYLIPLRGITVLIHLITKRPIGLQKPKNVTGRGPVLLIHGLNMDEVCMWYLRRCLIGDDWGPVTILHLGPLSWSNEENAQLLSQGVEEISKEYGKVHIIAHSMGGMVSRYYLQELHGGEYVLSLTTLATPHVGTPLAYLALSVCGRQLIPGSAFIRNLNDPAKPLPPAIPTLFLWSNLDILVPSKWGKSWDRNFSDAGKSFCFVPHLGHLTILHSRRVYEKIKEKLLEAEALKKDVHIRVKEQKML